MQKILKLTLASILALSIIGCGGRALPNQPKPSEAPQVEQPAQQPAPQTPAQPEQPATNPQPSQPQQPSTPQTPSQPNQQPSQPQQPSTPQTSPQPNQQPSQPQQPSTPQTPSQPSVQPQQPSNSQDAVINKFFEDIKKLGFNQSKEELTAQIIKIINTEAKGWQGKDEETSKKLLETAYNGTKKYFTNPAANPEEYLQRALKFINTKTPGEDEFYVWSPESKTTKDIEKLLILKYNKKTREMGCVKLDGKIYFYSEDKEDTYHKKFLLIPEPVYASPKSEMTASRFGIYTRNVYSYSTRRVNTIRWF